MSARKLAKSIVFAAAMVIASPFVVLTWLEKLVCASEAVFATCVQLLALAPGPIGTYVRAAYYRCVLEQCSWEIHIGFGSIFTHRQARLKRNVSTGVYCVIGHASIGQGVRIASRVSIPSGKRQHLDDAGNLSNDARYDQVVIADGCWLGEGAVVMADVGAESIVSAGAVVVSNVPPSTIVGGNPARIVKELRAVPTGSASGRD